VLQFESPCFIGSYSTWILHPFNSPFCVTRALPLLKWSQASCSSSSQFLLHHICWNTVQSSWKYTMLFISSFCLSFLCLCFWIRCHHLQSWTYCLYWLIRSSVWPGSCTRFKRLWKWVFLFPFAQLTHQFSAYQLYVMVFFLDLIYPFLFTYNRHITFTSTKSQF